MTHHFTTDAEATFALGQRLGERAEPGTVITLTGDLGAGKTVLAKGIGAGLGVPGLIQSPSFVLIQAHPGGRLPMWHADLYRLGDPEELEQLGLDEILEGEGVVVVEWAERFPELFSGDRLEIQLIEEGGGRRIRLRGHGPRASRLERALG